jgi:hypothetical protein
LSESPEKLRAIEAIQVIARQAATTAFRYFVPLLLLLAGYQGNSKCRVNGGYLNITVDIMFCGGGKFS